MVCAVAVMIQAAIAVTAPLPSPSPYADTESVTNVTFRAGTSGDNVFALSLELDASPSNNVEVSFGCDAWSRETMGSDPMVKAPGGGFEYSGFDWAGNESPFYIHRVSFPEVAVPRTDRTAVFRPHAMGEVFRPDWRKFKPGKTVSATAADYLAFNCIATMDDGACSHFLDMRGVSEFTCAIASLRMLLMCSSNDGVKSSQTTE